MSNDTNDTWDIFVYDRHMGQTYRASIASDGSQANNWAMDPSISANGRYVAFYSWASNLVSGDTNDHWDIFVHDQQTAQTSRVSISSDGTQGNSTSWKLSISADGRYVAFGSWASNLVSGDTNHSEDIFVHDRQTGQTSRVSVASDGIQGDNISHSPSISGDGRYVTFVSYASNLVSDDTNNIEDVFVHDRYTGKTKRVSIASAGTQANSMSLEPSISADGHYVVFHSWASNLVNNDTNDATDTFIHEWQTGETSRISIAFDGAQANSESGFPTVSADGRYVVFYSDANNLIREDTNEHGDVFVHDRGQ